jgi:hypothetical protein
MGRENVDWNFLAQDSAWKKTWNEISGFKKGWEFL